MESGEKTKMGRYFYMALAVSFALFCLTDSCMLSVRVSYGNDMFNISPYSVNYRALIGRVKKAWQGSYVYSYHYLQ